MFARMRAAIQNPTISAPRKPPTRTPAPKTVPSIMGDRPRQSADPYLARALGVAIEKNACEEYVKARERSRTGMWKGATNGVLSSELTLACLAPRAFPARLARLALHIAG